MQDLLTQVLAVFVTSSVAAILKMYVDIRLIKKDLNQAFKKIREIETGKNAVQDPALETPACRYRES